ISLTAFAHPADISYLRVKVERQRLEMRFTFNLLTLTRFVAVDGNDDKRIDKAELDAAEPALRRYLAEHIRVRINDQVATLGTPSPLVCLWPSPDTPPQAVEADYGQRHVDFVFAQEVKPFLEDVWLGFEIWQQTGPLGTVEATYEQEQMRTQVPFSQGEPDYLHDTGFTAEVAPPPIDPFAKPAEPKRLPLGLAIGIAGILAVGLELWRRKRYGSRP
ncbi:MAG: hypothetical protein U0984_13845, partial [Prosthecobacter sp.]|nr:hypothetical protein [Prosthecobacter sp.]